MSYEDFPNAPRPGQQFRNARDGQPTKPKEPTHYRNLPELDHQNLERWDYTPGGDLEQSVHSELSDRNRRHLRQQQERQHLDEAERRDAEHVNEVQERLDRQIKEAEQKREAKLKQEEREAKATQRKEQREKQAPEQDRGKPSERPDRKPADRGQEPRQARKYDMPRDGHDDPDKKPPGGRGRPHRPSRGGHDRGSEGHER